MSVPPPPICSQVLNTGLDLSFIQASTDWHYVDDLLLANQTKKDVLIDSLILLKALAERGRKTSRYKLQWVHTTVSYPERELPRGTQHSH